MTAHQSAFDASMGSPNSMAQQFNQDNMSKDRILDTLHCTRTVVGPSGNSGVAIDIPVGAKIVDVVVQCTATSNSGTVTIKTNADSPVAISDVIACETADAVDRAATIDTTYSTVTSDGLQAVSNGVDDEGIVFVTYLK